MEIRLDPGEAALIERARRGDPDAFGALVRSYEGRVRSFVATRVADPALADDLSQQVFVTAYQRLSAFDPSRPLLPWLRGIAQNLLRNESRRPRPEPLSAKLDGLAERQAEALPDEDLLAALRRCVKLLEGRGADLVRLRYVEGRPLEEIARDEGSTARALSMALIRIRERLRRCMSEGKTS